MQANSEFTQPLPWHSQAWAQLRNAYSSDRFPHAILLVGQAGLGKRVFASQLSNLLLCEQPDWDQLTSCQNCPACNKFSNESHPDFKRLEPQEGKKEISVDDVRNILNYIYLSANSSSGNKIIVIDPADKMGRSAANAILKSLEEPPSRRIIILIAESLGNIPATIRSRCQLIRFSHGSNELLKDWLKETSKGKYQPGTESIDELPPLKILQNLEENDDTVNDKLPEKLRQDWLDLVSHKVSAMNIAGQWLEIDEMNRVTHWLYRETIHALKHVLHHEAGNKLPVFVESGINLEGVLIIQNEINKLAAQKESNANSKLLWETFLLTCQSVARLNQAA